MIASLLFTPSMLADVASDPSGWQKYGVFGSLAALFLVAIVWLTKRRDADHAREMKAANERAQAAEARADRLENELRLVQATYVEKAAASKSETLSAIEAAQNLSASVIQAFGPPHPPRRPR